MRTPLGGRTFEAFGEDPFLVTRTTVGWIEGAQSQGVYATVKHFAANNQEGYDATGVAGQPGFPVGSGQVGTRYIENSIVDERTLREVYLPQFEAAVSEAHVGAVMCSYNRLNSDYACANDWLLNHVLKAEWGFPNMVMSDWVFATHPFGTVQHLNGGMDLEMPFADAYDPTAVQLALATGQSSQAALDDHVRRILRTLFAFGFFDRPAYANDDAQIDKTGHAAAAQQIEESAITLLDNHGGLPLDPSKLHSIAVIGPDANKFVTGGGSGNVTPYSTVTALQGIQSRVGPGVHVNYDDGSNATQAAGVAKSSDVAVVVVGDYETEGADRQCLTLECPNSNGDQDGLINAVAAAQPNTIVVLETGGPVLTPWRHSVKALLEAWYPGESGGTAIARVLFGDADPGGRLPVTFPNAAGDIPTAGDPAKYPGVGENVTYKEGVLVGYRWYDANYVTPAYPFGRGLSYTTFSYSPMRVTAAPGGGANVSFDVRNTGSRAGTDVPQLYVGIPQPSPSVVEPPRELKGFQKVALKPGGVAHVTIPLDQRSLSYWDVNSESWQVTPGCYGLELGHSSRDIARRATLAVGGANCPGAVASVGHKPARCTSRRSFIVHFHHLRARRIRRLTVFVNGKRQRTVRGHHRAIRVRLVGRPKGTVHVRLVAVTTKGRRRIDRRTYHLCALKRKHAKHRAHHKKQRR